MNQQQQQRGLFEECAWVLRIAVMLLHCAPVVPRMFSRKIGTMGGAYLFPGIFYSYAFQGVACAYGNMRCGSLLFAYIQVTGLLLIIHLFAYVKSYSTGRDTYSHCTGDAWFGNTLVCDTVVFGGLAYGAFAYGDPAIGEWFLLSILTSGMSDFLLALRDGARKRQVRSAKKFMDAYANTLGNNDDME